MKNSSREIETYTLTLHFNHMSLFKRNRCSKELIKLRGDNLEFKEAMRSVYTSMQKIMEESGKFDERLYFDLYREYRKHYIIYDIVPVLLLYKLPIIFNKRFPTFSVFNNKFTFTHLVPSENTYLRVPSCFCLPSQLEGILVKTKERVSPYIDMADINDIKYLRLVRANFLKQWDLFYKNPDLIDAYMENQLGMLIHWAKIENKTIVKNIIERTQDELAQEFLSKNDTYGK